MMSYSNIYDVIPICRTHARTEPVRTPKFLSDNASDKRQFCRLSLALSLPVRSHPMRPSSLQQTVSQFMLNYFT